MNQRVEEPKDYLKTCLQKNNMTQLGLAAALEIKHPTIAGWLSGKRPIPPRQAIKMRRLYGWNDEVLCPDLIEYREGVESIGEGVESIDPSDRTNPLAKRLQHIVELLNQRGWSEVSEQNVVFKIERIADEHVRMAERLQEIHKLSATS